MAKWIWAAALAAAMVFPTRADAERRHARMANIEQRELDQLRQRLMQLDREYAQKQAELDALQSRGVGGSGVVAAPVGIMYRGKVSAVSTFNRELNLKDEQGRTLVFPITRDTRAYRNGRRIAIDAIPRGTPVRVSLDLTNIQAHGRRPVREILVDPRP